MKTEELQTKIQEDLSIDLDSIQSALLDNTKLQAFYLNMLCSYRMLNINLKKKLALSRRDKYLYYSGKSETPCPYVYEKSEIKFLLETDTELLDIDEKIKTTEVKILLLEEACKAFTNRGFNLKTIVELRKFEAGVN